MVNTLSNIPFMLLGLYGIYRAVQAGFPLRVALSYLGLVVVGAGSTSRSSLPFLAPYTSR